MAQVSSPVPFVLFFLALAFVVEISTGGINGGRYELDGSEGSVHIEECPDKCHYRCSTSSYRKMCFFFCRYCCDQCLCVPSGTSGNKTECPCYNNFMCP